MGIANGSPQNGINIGGSVFTDVLEKKWSSLAKLKKQIMELEKQNK